MTSEVGIGTYTVSGTTLSRDTVLYSSAGGTTKITVAVGATVICTSPAEKVVILDGSGNATALGTPAAFVATNITGTASGFTAGQVTTNANLTGGVTSVGNAATVVTNANLTGMVTSVGNAASLGSFTSLQLATALTDETGTGANVFANSPTLVTPALGTPSSGTLTNCTNLPPAAVSDQANTSTGYFDLPAGTTAQRPVSPATGMIRYNTTESKYEVYTGSAWQFLSTSSYPYTVSYLVVAGGGGGGNASGYYGGGGGAGGLLASTASLTLGAVYTITVGAGGAQAANGSNSVLSGTGITTVTCVGGGKGGNSDVNGSSGGAGGGAGGNDAATTGGAATSGQGFVGGNHAAASATGGGGGGGTSSAGGNAEVTTGGGTGGAGLASSISGSSVTYSSGGGGQKGYYGLGTDGVNGTGWSNTANRGHGGAPTTQRAGSSGVVILSVPTANYTGTTTGSPTVTTSGANTILQFTASGSYTA
jgi:hypothetical protein